MSSETDKIWSFFDLDGTLIRKDSYLHFLIKWKFKYPKKILPILCLPLKYIQYLTFHREISYLKEAFLIAFMKGAKRSDVQSFVTDFWKQFLSKYQNDTIVNRLQWHHKNGHSVYIVTASFDFYTEHLKNIWPVDGVIATRAEWCGEILTGKMIGKNCKNEEKTRRIEKDLNINLQKIQYYAYSDSQSDLPLLKNAAFPILVKSSQIKRLKNLSDRSH